MYRAIALALLIVALAACGRNSPELGNPPPTVSPMNDPGLEAALQVIGPMLDQSFASSYAGLRVRNEVPSLDIYRKPDPRLDAEIRKAAPGVRIDFHDARYTKAEMAAVVKQVMDDGEHWKGRGWQIVLAGPEVDGSAVRVGTTAEPGDLAGELEKRYPAMLFKVERTGEIVAPIYTGPAPVFPTR